MIQGGMFGFPLLLIVLAVLLAIQPVRELGLIIASLYMQYRYWRLRRMGKWLFATGAGASLALIAAGALVVFGARRLRRMLP